MKLYDIPPEIDEFERILIDSGGELTPELEERWSAFVGASKDKLESAAFVICSIEDDIETQDKEVKRLQARKKSSQRNVDRLKDLTLYALKSLGGSLKTALVTMYIGRTGVKTIVEVKEGTDLAALKQQYPELVRVKMEINLEQAKAMLKAGAELPDCLTVRNEPPTESLQIR